MKSLKAFVLAVLLSLFSVVGVAAQVNINTATQDEIKEELNGIGEKKAMAIVEYRKLNGDFKQIEDLLKVKGVGEAIVAKNRDKIVFE